MTGSVGPGGPRRSTNASRSSGSVGPELPQPPRQTYRLVLSLGIAVAVVWSGASIELKWSRLLEAPADLWTNAQLMLVNMEWAYVGDLVAAMWESICIAWIGTVIAAIFALPLAFLAAENLVGKAVSWSVRQVLNLLRAIPEIILALAFVPIFGLTPMAGVMAIAIGSIGTLGKLCFEIIEGLKPDPIEAADAVGANSLQRLRWGVLPQVLPELSSFVLYRFEVNIRVSAILGLVDAGGIGENLAASLKFANANRPDLWGQAGVGLTVVIVGTIIVDVISGAIRRRIVAGPRSDRSMDTDAMTETDMALTVAES